MSFGIDKQTLDDLNIFSRNNDNSIFEIYNQARTAGGAAILDNMFHHPLSDEGLINQRSAVFQHFALYHVRFPFKIELFDAVEQYLANTDERTMLQAQDNAIGKKLSNLIATDPEYKTIINGITAIIELMVSLNDFLKSAVVISALPYVNERKAIETLLADADLLSVLKDRGRLQHTQIVAYDKIFRFRSPKKIRAILQYMYQLDIYTAIAALANQRNFVFPKALPKDQHTLLLEGAYHPRLKDAVVNTVQMSSAANLIFLTGANMAGKSTFMKTFGTVMLLAHIGLPVAAKKMEFSVRDGIYSTINLPDNLALGASHFYAEVLRIKKIAKEIRQEKNLFIIFDELFRGTNVKDAYEATVAITSAFAKKTNCFFVISTHIIEAGEVLKERCDNIAFRYLPTKMNGSQPVYTYQLEKGITDDRHGMIIIRNEGILDILEAGAIKQI